jgi:hypothetical protein
MGLVRRKDKTIIVVDMKIIQNDWRAVLDSLVEQDDQGNPELAFTQSFLEQ